MYDPHTPPTGQNSAAGYPPAQPPGAGYPPGTAYPPGAGYPPGTGYPPAEPPGMVPPSAQRPGAGYPPGMVPPPARPPALYVVLGLVLVGGVLTFVAAYLDHRFLADMFSGNEGMAQVLPTFTTVRLVVDAVGVVLALGLLVPTFLGLNWARILLAVACFGYAVANLGAALVAGFTLVAGRGAFNQGGDATSTNVSVLNGLSLTVDVVLLFMVVVCAVILLTGKTKTYAKARTLTR